MAPAHRARRPHRLARSRTGARAEATLAALALVVFLTGCGDPPVLEVGRIGYGAEAVAGLDAAALSRLMDLTAFGLAVADRRLDDAAAPFVERDLRSLVLQRAALEIGAAEVGIDEDALRAEYDAAPDHELVVRHLVVLSERWRPAEHRDSARARAEAALEQARAGESFEALAAEYSDEPGAAERGGLLQPGREGSWVREFWAAASSLEPGQVSDVVETEFGYHVIRLESRDPVPFEEARDRVLEQTVDLADALSRSARWIEERTRGAVVDTGAVRAWQAGEDPGRALVRWPDPALPPYEAAHLDDYALTLPPSSAAALREGDAAYTASVVGSAARSRVLLEHARRLGIEATPAQRTAVAEQWRTRMTGWAGALGYSPGMADRAVRARSLELVDAQRQDVLIARAELLRLSAVLRQLYPVRVAEPDQLPSRSSDAVNRLTGG
jgi:hypothetical protein